MCTLTEVKSLRYEDKLQPLAPFEMTLATRMRHHIGVISTIVTAPLQVTATLDRMLQAGLVRTGFNKGGVCVAF
jgi:hypothetical protein